MDEHRVTEVIARRDNVTSRWRPPGDALCGRRGGSFAPRRRFDRDARARHARDLGISRAGLRRCSVIVGDDRRSTASTIRSLQCRLRQVRSQRPRPDRAANGGIEDSDWGLVSARRLGLRCWPSEHLLEASCAPMRAVYPGPHMRHSTHWMRSVRRQRRPPLAEQIAEAADDTAPDRGTAS